PAPAAGGRPAGSRRTGRRRGNGHPTTHRTGEPGVSMKWFLRIVVIVAVLIAGALGWQWLAADPGLVQVRIRGYVIETSVIAAVAMTLLVFIAIWLLWWLLRAPLRWLSSMRRRRARHAFAQAELRLREGHWARAEKLFVRAAEDPDFRVPA